MAFPSQPHVGANGALEQELATLIVEALRLEVLPENIDPSSALFGEGLGLDSIDMLEIALLLSKRYGVELRSENKAALASLRALASHISQHRIR
ncbi:MAG: phosphopantetheine-binding protein [Nitrospira sp.]